MYDVIIVGARCAGSPTAALLARKGHKVLVVDRARFPSDTMSTHFIHHPGVAHLARWGMLDKMMATNVPPITSTAFGAVGEPPVEIPPIPGIPGAIAPRRTVLDKILVDEAVAAGAELRENFTFEDVVREDDRVVGIRGRSTEGNTVTEKALLVVGADGRHSSFATAVGADAYKHVAPLGCGYYSYWSGFANKGVEVYFLDTNVFILFPTNDGLTVVIALWPVDRFRR
ncbi:MAG: FAD-dependent monooxygenase [Actinomycetota bacterium]|nr:FAD-dependent monooxygenase [Actinomycetota bacterium]